MIWIRNHIRKLVKEIFILIVDGVIKWYRYNITNVTKYVIALTMQIRRCLELITTHLNVEETRFLVRCLLISWPTPILTSATLTRLLSVLPLFVYHLAGPIAWNIVHLSNSVSYIIQTNLIHRGNPHEKRVEVLLILHVVVLEFSNRVNFSNKFCILRNSK